MDLENTIKYHLYIDECGDQNLETFSPTFPIFTLCGILVRDTLVPKLENVQSSMLTTSVRTETDVSQPLLSAGGNEKTGTL